MNIEIGHERCSELLRDHVAGRLGPGDAASVSAHLAGCAECARERVALEALMVELEPMTDIERTRLHQAIGRVIEVAELGPAETGAPAGWRARLLPALGAAALIAVVAVAIASLDLTGSTDEDAGGGGGDPQQLEIQDAPADGVDTAALEALGFGITYGGELGTVRGVDLTRIGKDGFPSLEAFSATVEAAGDEGAGSNGVSGGARTKMQPATDEQLRATADAALASLVDQATDPDVKEQIASCGRTVFDESADPVVPAYAALARYQKSEVLLIGFRYRKSDSSELNSFLLWAWPRGGSCDTPIDYRSGNIRS